MYPIIRAQGLCFMDKLYYPDFSILEGAVVLIKGPSGSGKSTLFKLLNQMYDHSAGTIWFRGIDMERIDTISLRRQIMLAGQQVWLFPGTIEENFRQFHAIHGTPVPDEAEMSECLHICSLDTDIHRTVDTMSGGERQRVFIAIAVSMNPKVLMLDEPTAALDAVNAETVMRRIKERCQERNLTLLVVSHDDRLMEGFADQIIQIGGN